MTPAVLHSIEFGQIAARLAAIADLLPGDDNLHRAALREVGMIMSSAQPSLNLATSRTLLPLMDLLQPKMVDKPETWLLAAVAVLIAHEKMRLAGGVAPAPAGMNLS